MALLLCALFAALRAAFLSGLRAAFRAALRIAFLFWCSFSSSAKAAASALSSSVVFLIGRVLEHPASSLSSREGEERGSSRKGEDSAISREGEGRGLSEYGERRYGMVSLSEPSSMLSSGGLTGLPFSIGPGGELGEGRGSSSSIGPAGEAGEGGAGPAECWPSLLSPFWTLGGTTTTDASRLTGITRTTSDLGGGFPLGRGGVRARGGGGLRGEREAGRTL